MKVSCSARFALFLVVACVCQALIVSPFAHSQVAPPEVDFGAVNIGSASPVIAVPLTFNTEATLGSVSVLTGGASGLDFANAGAGTCTTGASYNAGSSCTVNVTFAPVLAGSRYGAVALVDGSYSVIASSYLHGTGVGPQLNPVTATGRTMSTNVMVGPSEVAADASSNVSLTATTPITCTASTTSSFIAGICTLNSLATSLATQTITFGAIPTQAVNTSVGVALIASASSGFPVSFTSTTPAVCTISASTATLLTAGTCTIQANQAGNSAYAAAPTVTQSFTVESANPLTGSSFGSVNIGSVSSATLVTITFGTAATLGHVSVVTQGATGLDFTNAGTGTCIAGTSYNTGGSCTVNVTFTPTFAGSRYGAVVLVDGSGNVIATSYLQGTGVGPQVDFLPGTESTVPTSALSYPSGVAVDGSGNVYIVDSGNNRILKETLSAGSYAESTVPTGALSYPSGVAVDGSGNVYIADSGNNRVLKETISAGSYTESMVSTSALSWPSGIAVDGSGNAYIADSGNNRVLIETLSVGSYTESTVPTSALSYPSSVAVDGSGNIYIADTGNNRVVIEMLSSGSYTESAVPTSTTAYPSGVVVAGSGNVYIADTGNNRVLLETLSAGSYTESTVPTSALSYPSGVVVAGSGNVYVVDTGNNRVLKESFSDPPNLSFASTALGSTSSDSPQAVTLVNAGNAALNFPIPGSGNNPSIATNFTLNNSGLSACPKVSAGSSTAGMLGAGQSCLLLISFTPAATGSISGTLVLTDNALNPTVPGYTAQSILLSGIGTGSTPQSITFGSIPAQSVNSILALTATASSGLPVSFTSTTPAICTVTGTTASLLASGTCTIQANQGGSSVYAAAPAVTQSFTVNPLAQTITFGTIPAQTANTSVGITLTATASSGLPVSFTSTTPAICTVSASMVTLLASGTCTIQASQAGNALYAAAPMVTQSFAVESVNPLTGRNLGTVNIGSASSAIAVPITFNTAATLGSVSVLTQGATGLDFVYAGAETCTVGTSYNASGSCTVNVTFKPMLAGTRYGAVVLLDGSGNAIGTSYLQGLGVGPQVNFLPGAETTVSTSTLYNPSGVVVDASGNVYIADYGNSRVLKETASANTYTESTVPTSSLSGPSGVAVDGSGNLYIADSANNRVLKETLSAGSYTESTVPTSALNWPSGIAVDGSGDVYIADTGNNRVLMETLSAGSYTESTAPTSALSYPSGVAVDGSGNLYIADSGNNRALVETLSAGSYTESIVPTSALSFPAGLTVDGSGNIFIADSGNSRVLKEMLSASIYVESTVPTSGLNWPSGVAVDGSGNVYIADSGNNRMLKEDFADPPSLSFGATAPGSASSDSPQIVTLENVGNATLNFPIPSSGNNPSISANFTLNGSGAASSCPLVSAGSSAAATLAAGQSCLLPISFTPQAAGTFNGTLVLTDNTLNAAAPGYAAQSILLNGIGTGSTQQTIAFGSIPAQFVESTIVLAASASSGLPVSLTSTTPSVCTVSASFASLLAAGTCTIQANQAGSPVYSAAPTVTQSFAVTLLAQTIIFNAIPAQMINTSAPVTLNAWAYSGLPVSFTSTTSTVCTASSTASTATLLAAGTCTIQASQPGDGVVYAAALTVTQSFTVESANPLLGTNFGTVSIGSASSTIAVPLTFGTTATLSSVSALTQGATGLDFANVGAGTCTPGTTYSAISSCTVNVTFTPTLAGTRYGAVVLQDGYGNVIATSYLQGTGVGPQVNFLPGTESMVLTSSFFGPSNVVVDGSGNIYIADGFYGRVLKETPLSGGYTESMVPTSVLSNPSGVAVDGSGNVYIADSYNNRVLKETLSAGSYVESTVPTSALSYPSGIAVDGSGNIYIADLGNNRVLVETLSGSSYTESTVPTSSLANPFGIAVDGSGNVYIADTNNNRVLVETLSKGSYTESTVATSALGFPVGVAVDGNGNVYVIDNYGYGLGNSNVLKETLSAGSYTESTVPTSSLFGPEGVAVDGSGNVFIADTGNHRVLKEDFSDPPSLSFALTAPGSMSSDSPQTITVENVGNAALNFSIPSSENNPSITANFTLNSSGSSSCPLVSTGASTVGALATGQSCLLPISFAPSIAGNISGTLVLTDNALNAAAPGYAAQSILLSGIGAGSTQQSITFGPIPAQTLNSTLALTATASSGLPVSLTSNTPTICTVSGPVWASTATLLATGTCIIQASQTGSTVYAAAPAVIQSFMVNPLAQTIAFGAIPAQALNTSVAVSLVATASSGLPVSFTSTTSTICTVSASTVTLVANGTCTIQANQAGNGAYAAASMVTQSFTVEPANPLTGTSFGTTNIGTASSAIPVAITFGTAAALGSVSVLTGGATGLDFADSGGGTCSPGTSYNAGDSCIVNVTFTPMFAGTRYGAVVLDDDSGNVIATSYLQGTGLGPQLTFLPGTESTVPTSALASPFGVAVDGSSNIYIVDTYNNRLLKETFSAGNYTESTVPTSVLTYPAGVAVDGGGNVYIADTGNNRVLKETLSAGSYTESTIPTSALNWPFGVAVDGSGNVYIADTYNQRILEETLSSGSYTESMVPTSSLNGPFGVAVDQNGNIYIADLYNQRVLKETLSAGSYTESIMPSSTLDGPEEVAVDGNGNVYISDWGYYGLNYQVLKETFSAGSYTESTVSTSTLDAPSGLAADGSGNVYISDTYNNRVLKEDLADPPSLSFATTVVGSTSSDSPQVVTVENIGNATLNFPIPSSGNNPSIPANFTLNSSGASACPLLSAGSSTAGALPAGQSCLLPISFTPTAAGNLSGTLVLTDNALNAAAPGFALQSIQLSGTGTQASQTSDLKALASQAVVIAKTTHLALGAVDPIFHETIVGFSDSDTALTRATGASNLTTTALESSPAGGFTTNAVVDTLAPATYSSTSVSGTLAVTPLGTVVTPSFMPAPGTYSSSQTVTISDTTSGSTIYYTIDGTMPTTSSTVYTGAITASALETIKSIAVATGHTNSVVASAAFIIK